MKREATLVTIILIVAFSYSAEAGVSVTASYEYADISGVRTYNAFGFTNGSETTSCNVPRISLRGKVHKYIEIGGSYAFIGNLQGNGVAGNGRVFPPPGATTVVEFYRFEEDIHDLTLFAGGSFNLHPSISISAGPELHYLISRIKFYSSSQPVGSSGGSLLRTIESDDWRVGIYGTAKFKLGKSWHIQGSYRFVKPPDRDIHFFGIGVGYSF